MVKNVKLINICYSVHVAENVMLSMDVTLVKITPALSLCTSCFGWHFMFSKVNQVTFQAIKFQKAFDTQMSYFVIYLNYCEIILFKLG